MQITCPLCGAARHPRIQHQGSRDLPSPPRPRRGVGGVERLPPQPREPGGRDAGAVAPRIGLRRVACGDAQHDHARDARGASLPGRRAMRVEGRGTHRPVHAGPVHLRRQDRFGLQGRHRRLGASGQRHPAHGPVVQVPPPAWAADRRQRGAQRADPGGPGPRDGPQRAGHGAGDPRGPDRHQPEPCRPARPGPDGGQRPGLALPGCGVLLQDLHVAPEVLGGASTSRSSAAPPGSGG
jgi:hypothetical protein